MDTLARDAVLEKLPTITLSIGIALIASARGMCVGGAQNTFAAHTKLSLSIRQSESKRYDYPHRDEGCRSRLGQTRAGFVLLHPRVC